MGIKKINFQLLAIFFVLFVQQGTGSAQSSLESGYAEWGYDEQWFRHKRELISEFIAGIKANDPDKVSNYISYPLVRESPIPPIINEHQFVNRFREVFDDNLISKIVTSDIEKDWGVSPYKGITLYRACPDEKGVYCLLIRFNLSGRLVDLNYLSDRERELKKKYLKILEKPIGNDLDYGISNMRFVTLEGVIPNGCFGQLMTELSGDTYATAVIVNSASPLGCISANGLYRDVVEEEVSYSIHEKLNNHTYRLEVCEIVHGSLGYTCDRILVRFINRDYTVQDKTIKGLSIEKIGEW